VGTLVVPVLVALVALAGIVTVGLVIALAVFVSLGAFGVLALGDRAGRAKRLASTADPDEAW
jgi:hypothetical protein